MHNELLALAHWAGNHPARLVLGCEGAVAATVPDGATFVISATQAKLIELQAANLVQLDLVKARALIALEDATPEQLAAAQMDPATEAPSADALAVADLFAFPGVHFALHTQPIPVNQVICSPRARQFSDRRNLPDEILACGQASVLVPFMPPGLPLAKEIRRRIALWRDRYKTIPRLILIQNHGMIALGATAAEVQTITEMAVKYAEIFIGAAMMGGPEFLKPNYVTQIDATKIV
ncbi:MAG: class II aldolase/adducin family protein [Verrucomicrobia bacterium]|nr:class II aldolase/adducin family protein [Verrucomicrobiota bacterium]